LDALRDSLGGFVLKPSLVLGFANTQKPAAKYVDYLCDARASSLPAKK
jgi:hypothetical protein